VIDWPRVAFNTLWIVGCALILAAFSHTHWLARTRSTRTRQLLGAPTFQIPLSVGLVLISLSLFFLGRGWLEHVLWAVFTCLFAWQAWGLWRDGRTQPEDSDE
jgi:hypothetical protein